MRVIIILGQLCYINGISPRIPFNNDIIMIIIVCIGIKKNFEIKYSRPRMII